MKSSDVTVVILFLVIIVLVVGPALFGQYPSSYIMLAPGLAPGDPVELVSAGCTEYSRNCSVYLVVDMSQCAVHDGLVFGLTFEGHPLLKCP